ncbi:MAG: thioesterase [Anaerolineae bacterium]|nr:thioesterase [Anaerolineae bacterium]
MTPETLTTQWVSCPKYVTTPKLRLICFPPAGSGTVIYQKWAKQIPPEVEMWIMRLPGRETRLREPTLTHVSTIVESVAEMLIPHLQQPYILFGHSLGSLVCFELCCYLRENKRPLPLHLLLSGHRAPHRPPLNPPVHQANNQIFLDRIKKMGGTPDKFFEMKELVAMMLPALRADFTAWETYQYQPHPPLDIPITALGSDDDHDATQADIFAWEQHTTGEFTAHIFHGNHFYFLNEPEPLLNLINDTLAQYL